MDAPTEQLTADWLSETDPAKQQSPLQAVQARAMDQAPCLPLGQFFVKTAFRDTVQGVRNGSVCYLWDVRKS